MPLNDNAAIEITAFKLVPEFAQGVVRDLRVRWALEEAGLDYRARLLDQVRRCNAGVRVPDHDRTDQRAALARGLVL